MKQCRMFVCAVVGVWLIWSVDAKAQDVSAACAGLDQLREGAPTSSDHQTLDDCVRAMLSELTEAASSPLTIDRGVRDFGERFAAQFNDENNTRAFKDKFTERAAALLHAELKKGQALGPEVARAVTRALTVLGAVHCQEALLEGLVFPDQVVRYLSAKGLAALRDEIGADARLTSLTLAALGQAGKNEINDVVAAMIFRASAYRNRPAEAVGAILQTLDGRLDHRRAMGKGFGRSELAALGILSSLVGDNKLDSGLKAEVVRRLAPLLRLHTKRFGSGDVPEDELDAIKDTIDQTEKLLETIVAPSPSAPSVSAKMQKGGPAVADEMELELIDWIGTAQEEGILSQAPWNVPRGAP